MHNVIGLSKTDDLDRVVTNKFWQLASGRMIHCGWHMCNIISLVMIRLHVRSDAEYEGKPNALKTRRGE